MNDKEEKAIGMCRLLLNGDITLHIIDDDGGTAYAGTVNKTYNDDLETVLNLIEKQKAEIENKDIALRECERNLIEERQNRIKEGKIIDLMAKELVKAHEWFYSKFDNYTKEDFIKYFEKKAEEE